MASRELDPECADPEPLRNDLRAWAVEQLIRQRCEFGLYVAEFSTWKADGDPGYFLRLIYFVWRGDEVFTTHVEDEQVNFAGVCALTNQADAYDGLLKRT